ncbi:MAG: 16S rRNA (cytosine(967)-C(5))-methyltransferase RsmB [Planctomycetota bacterium]|jgi:16S rRNA (cytosine967-C5)-methyltransferase
MAKGKSVREHAFNILVQAFFNGRKAAPLIRGSARQLDDRRDRSLLTELVNGTLKMWRTLDTALEKRLNKSLARHPDNVQVALRLGLMQLLFLDRIPAHAAVHESVELIKKKQKKGSERFTKLVNAVLRRLAEKITAVGKSEFITSLAEIHAHDPVRKLAVQFSYTDYFVQSLLETYGEEEIHSILAAGNENPDITLRINLNKTTRDELSSAIAKAGIATEPGGIESSLRLLGPADVSALPGFAEGLFFVQDETAQKVAPFLAPRESDRILDLCAAPGGKTTHFYELTGGKAEITAVDSSVERMGELEKNLFRMRTTDIRAIAADAKSFCLENQGGFDRILVDVPCSNSGVLRRRPEARLRLEYNKVKSLSDRSYDILTAAGLALRPGGMLVYSTCSILPLENEKVISAFLEKHAGFALDAEEVILPGPGGPDGAYMARLVRKADLA